GPDDVEPLQDLLQVLPVPRLEVVVDGPLRSGAGGSSTPASPGAGCRRRGAGAAASGPGRRRPCRPAGAPGGCPAGPTGRPRRPPRPTAPPSRPAGKSPRSGPGAP